MNDKDKPKKRKNRSGLFIIALFIIVLGGSLFYREQSLIAKKHALQSKYNELCSKYEDEMERAKELANRQAYMQTLKYIEDVAREKLGLVYKGEIVFREENEDQKNP